MKLDGGLNQKKSYFGACLTMFLTMVTLVFTYTKIQTIAGKYEVDIMGATIENAFTDQDTFSIDDGFFIAVGLTEYDSNTEIIEDPKYGELIIEHYGWGYETAIGS